MQVLTLSMKEANRLLRPLICSFSWLRTTWDAGVDGRVDGGQQGPVDGHWGDGGVDGAGRVAPQRAGAEVSAGAPAVQLHGGGDLEGWEKRRMWEC